MINTSILKNEEKAAFALRSLYSSFGYERFKMSKFEEYDLYVRNKDFLISEGIITFTDTNGRLLALKPDVTLSIIKNTKDVKGYVEKLYYDENVYRISKDSRSFKEIAQTGLECIGDISLNDICEVLYLAIRSLESIGKSYIMDISHAGLTKALLDLYPTEKETREKVLSLIQDKNADGVKLLLSKDKIRKEVYSLALILIASYKNTDELKAALMPYLTDENVSAAFGQFSQMYLTLQMLGMSEKINIDFSIVSDVSYYSGVVFKGYIEGIPTSVLSGGQYDKLMKKMGKSSGAIGFAVYLDMLERFGKKEKEYDYDTVILMGEYAPAEKVIKTAQELTEKGERVITLRSVSQLLKYKRLIKIGFEEEEKND